MLLAEMETKGKTTFEKPINKNNVRLDMKLNGPKGMQNLKSHFEISHLMILNGTFSVDNVKD